MFDMNIYIYSLRQFLRNFGILTLYPVKETLPIGQ